MIKKMPFIAMRNEMYKASQTEFEQIMGGMIC